MKNIIRRLLKGKEIIPAGNKDASAGLFALTSVKTGEKGVVRHIEGGHGVTQRLSSLGIRVGKEITKGNSMFYKGPVVLTVDRRQLAIGFGMASKIKIEKR